MRGGNLEFVDEIVRRGLANVMPHTASEFIIKMSFESQDVKFGFNGRGELYAQVNGDKFIFNVPSSGELVVHSS